MKKFWETLRESGKRGKALRFNLGVMCVILGLSTIAAVDLLIGSGQVGVLCAGIGLMGFIDEDVMTDDKQKEFIQGLDNALEGLKDSFFKDSISKKEFSEELAKVMEGIKSINEDKLSKAIDKETFESFKKEILEDLIRFKSATEVSPRGEVVVKSLEDQVRGQIKEFITKDKNGCEIVNLKEACQKQPGNKLNLFIVPNKKELTASSVVTSNVSTAGTPLSTGVVFDNSISTPPLAESEIRQYSNVATIGARMVIYAQLKDTKGDAEWVPEGGLKPSMSAEIEEVSVTAGKVALTATLTEETLTDLPQLVAEIRSEIIYKIGVKEEEGILFGTGQNGEVKGVFTDIPEFTLTGLKVDTPNYYDALIAAYTQIVSVSKQNYAPNLVRVNPIDLANMKLTKDSAGNYLFPPFTLQDGTLITGVNIRPSTNVNLGEFYMGDFRYLNIRDYAPLSIRFGWVNDDFKKNLIEMLGEKRLLAYIKSNYKTAFVKGSYKTIMEAIDVASTPSGSAA